MPRNFDTSSNTQFLNNGSGSSSDSRLPEIHCSFLSQSQQTISDRQIQADNTFDGISGILGQPGSHSSNFSDPFRGIITPNLLTEEKKTRLRNQLDSNEQTNILHNNSSQIEEDDGEEEKVQQDDQVEEEKLQEIQIEDNRFLEDNLFEEEKVQQDQVEEDLFGLNIPEVDLEQENPLNEDEDVDERGLSIEKEENNEGNHNGLQKKELDEPSD